MKSRSVLLATLLVATLLAGCAADEASELQAAPEASKFTIMGRVLTPAFNPIEAATVTLVQPALVRVDGNQSAEEETLTARTDRDGGFTLPGVWAGQRTLNITHADYHATTQTVTAAPNATVQVSLTPIARIVPFQESFPFKGYIECGAEYLIISPSCDTLITFLGGPELFEDTSVFDVLVNDDWQTLVLDVFFEDADHPGIAGIRVSAYADDADSALLEYERITQTWGDAPFTLRIEPGMDYGDALPAPIDRSDIRFEFFPHGHAGDTPFLGVGVAFRLEFEAVATIFYHEAAPEGWTLLA